MVSYNLQFMDDLVHIISADARFLTQEVEHGVRTALDVWTGILHLDVGGMPPFDGRIGMRVFFHDYTTVKMKAQLYEQMGLTLIPIFDEVEENLSSLAFGEQTIWWEFDDFDRSQFGDFNDLALGVRYTGPDFNGGMERVETQLPHHGIYDQYLDYDADSITTTINDGDLVWPSNRFDLIFEERITLPRVTKIYERKVIGLGKRKSEAILVYVGNEPIVASGIGGKEWQHTLTGHIDIMTSISDTRLHELTDAIADVLKKNVNYPGYVWLKPTRIINRSDESRRYFRSIIDVEAIKYNILDEA